MPASDLKLVAGLDLARRRRAAARSAWTLAEAGSAGPPSDWSSRATYLRPSSSWTSSSFCQTFRHDEKDAHLGRENAAALRLLQAPAAPSPARPTRPATSLLLPRPSSARLREPPCRGTHPLAAALLRRDIDAFNTKAGIERAVLDALRKFGVLPPAPKKAPQLRLVHDDGPEKPGPSAD